MTTPVDESKRGASYLYTDGRELLLTRSLHTTVPFKSWCPAFPEGRLDRQMTLELAGTTIRASLAS